MISTGMYPVIWAVKYKSGKHVTGVCDKGWPKVHADIKRAQELGSIVDFRFTTAIDRRNRGLIVTRRGDMIRVPRAATKQPAKLKRRPRTWRR